LLDKKNCYGIFVRSFNEIKLSKLCVKQSSATEASVFPTCIMLIHKFRAADQKGYFSCWSNRKADVTILAVKVRKLTCLQKRTAQPAEKVGPNYGLP
jgi:hypothetical protein